MAMMPHTHGIAAIEYEAAQTELAENTSLENLVLFCLISILGIFVTSVICAFALACLGVAWLQPLAAFYRVFNLDVPVPFWLELMFAVPITIALLWLGIHAYRLYRKIRIWLYYLSFSFGL